MTFAHLALPVLALASLAACVVPVPVPPGTPGAIVVDEGDSCGAGGLEEFLGQDRSVVAATTFTAPVRVIGPDDAVTMDFNPERVNFRTDASGRIVEITCG